MFCYSFFRFITNSASLSWGHPQGTRLPFLSTWLSASPWEQHNLLQVVAVIILAVLATFSPFDSERHTLGRFRGRPCAGGAQGDRGGQLTAGWAAEGGLSVSLKTWKVHYCWPEKGQRNTASSAVKTVLTMSGQMCSLRAFTLYCYTKTLSFSILEKHESPE